MDLKGTGCNSDACDYLWALAKVSTE